MDFVCNSSLKKSQGIHLFAKYVFSFCFDLYTYLFYEA